MERLLTREQLAELHGVSPATVSLWEREGMPSITGEAGPHRGGRLRGGPHPWHATRREVAELLGVHADTLTRKLRDGLAAAVLEPGGQGAEMIFDLRLAYRWWLAAEGQLNRVVLDDFRACAQAGTLALSQLPATALLHGQAQPERRPRRRERNRTT